MLRAGPPGPAPGRKARNPAVRPGQFLEGLSSGFFKLFFPFSLYLFYYAAFVFHHFLAGDSLSDVTGQKDKAQMLHQTKAKTTKWRRQEECEKLCSHLNPEFNPQSTEPWSCTEKYPGRKRIRPDKGHKATQWCVCGGEHPSFYETYNVKVLWHFSFKQNVGFMVSS